MVDNPVSEDFIAGSRLFGTAFSGRVLQIYAELFGIYEAGDNQARADYRHSEGRLADFAMQSV
jgi:hypothetical protein